jgi:hypothetical protein
VCGIKVGDHHGGESNRHRLITCSSNFTMAALARDRDYGQTGGREQVRESGSTC